MQAFGLIHHHTAIISKPHNFVNTCRTRSLGETDHTRKFASHGAVYEINQVALPIGMMSLGESAGLLTHCGIHNTLRPNQYSWTLTCPLDGDMVYEV